jgi:hypothetical protein
MLWLAFVPFCEKFVGSALLDTVSAAEFAAGLLPNSQA